MSFSGTIRLRGHMNNRLIMRLGAGLTAMATIGALGAIGATSAAANGLQILPTTTTVVANPSSVVSTPGASVTLTATVGSIDLYVTPAGSVYFTITEVGSPFPINSPGVGLNNCIILLSKCTATLVVPLPDANPGIYTVVAHYTGDSLSKPSAGSTTVVVNDAGTS